MRKAFVTLHGGLGNQLFQAAFAEWLRKTQSFHVQLIDPGPKGLPGRQARVCQLNNLLVDEVLMRGPVAALLHFASLSRKWQITLGRFGLIRRAGEPSFEHDLPNLDSLECRRLDRYGLSVFYGYWQNSSVLTASASHIRSRAQPELIRRAERLDQELMHAGRPRISETLVVHVRRGDLASLNGILLLDSLYYKRAFAALIRQAEFEGKAPRAIGIVSDQPEIALPIVQAVEPSAAVLDLQDPLDALAALSMAHSRILANSTLSVWGGVLGPLSRPTVYPSVWDMVDNRGFKLCQPFDWISVNPLATST